VSETLFSQIQALFERTYAQVGINLEDCIIDRARCSHLSKLAGASARELSDLARTFLRRAGDQLYVGIYYSRWLIEQLERNDPRDGWSPNYCRSSPRASHGGRAAQITSADDTCRRETCRQPGAEITPPDSSIPARKHRPA